MARFPRSIPFTILEPNSSKPTPPPFLVAAAMPSTWAKTVGIMSNHPPMKYGLSWSERNRACSGDKSNRCVSAS